MFFRLIAAALILALHGPLAMAQAYPNRMVTIVVPFPAGGGVDALTRAVAAELSTKWKQTVIIENKSGAGSLVGAGAVAKAPADGYTLMATVNQTMTTNPFLYKTLPYDPVKSFAPIQLMVQSDMFVLANPKVPANNLKELLALVRKEPQKHNFGSFGFGSQPHLMFAHFNQRENIDLLHVPFPGVAPLLTAVTGGHVELTTGSAGVGGELMKGGKLKALAIVGNERSKLFPDVPTAAESGFPYLRSSIWYALFAPRGTSNDIIEKINSDVRQILSNHEFTEKYVTSKGLRLIASSPAQLATVIDEETASMAEMVKAAAVKPE
jgi:tripartite-type tricarboxylate transporter receptor subunit TctC